MKSIRTCLIIFMLTITAAGFVSSASAQDLDGRAKMERTRALMAEAGQMSPGAGVTLASSAPTGPSWVRMLSGLALCIGLFLVVTGLIKRKQGGSAPSHARHLRVVERLALSGKHSVVLLEIDGARYLAGLGAEQIALTALSSPNEVELALQAEELEQQAMIELSHRMAVGQ